MAKRTCIVCGLAGTVGHKLIRNGNGRYVHQDWAVCIKLLQAALSAERGQREAAEMGIRLIKSIVEAYSDITVPWEQVEGQMFGDLPVGDRA